MKNDLTCGVVRDLLPSYADGIAGEETAAAVERHMAECEECRAALHRMKEPEDAVPPEEKEIDYLKKVRRRGMCKVTAVLAAAALLAMAVTLGVLYKGVPAEPGAIAAAVTVRDGTVRVTGTLTDSGRVLSRAHITQDESGAVEVRINVTPLLFTHSGDFTLEHPAAREVTSVSVNGLILWENGKAIDWTAARLYEAKNPYVGDMSANAHIASLLRIGNRVGSFTNELQTDAEPYGWTLLLDAPVTAAAETDIREEMQKCSCVLLATIDNLGTVTWKYQTETGQSSYSVTAAEASRMAGRDIKTCAESAAALQSLLETIGIL